MPKAKERDCGCSKPKGEPGIAKIYISTASIKRNRIPGNPVTLPAIVISRDGKTTYADRLEIEGPCVLIQNDTDIDSPAVWIETAAPVTAYLEGKKT